MTAHIPFAYNAKDCDLVKAYYADSQIVRLSLENATKILDRLPTDVRLWVDGAVDGFHRWPDDVSRSWKDHIMSFAGWKTLGDRGQLQLNPDKSAVEDFVSRVLDRCHDVSPRVTWVSVPQLPAVKDVSRNRLNRLLADAASAWRARSKFRGKLILPVVLTHQDHANLKTDRNQRIKLASQCFERAGADGYWLVETSLSDQTGAGTYEKKRFPGLISLHKEIADELKTDGPSVAGPYWALNLVLWARGLITNPAIGLGVGYQYHVPGGIAKPAKKRMALPPLRRWAIVSPKLEEWLGRLPKQDPAHRELRELQRAFTKFINVEDEGRRQVARFYKSWFDKIATIEPSGRALALYQDFSTAYVLGKPLPELPEDEGTARRPERIAEQFMLQCL